MRAEASATMDAARAATSRREGLAETFVVALAVSARLAAGLVAAVLATVSARRARRSSGDCASSVRPPRPGL